MQAVADRVVNAVANGLKKAFPDVPVKLNARIKQMNSDALFLVSVYDSSADQTALRGRRVTIYIDVAYLIKEPPAGVLGLFAGVFERAAEAVRVVTHKGETFRLRNIRRSVTDDVLHIYAETEVLTDGK